MEQQIPTCNHKGPMLMCTSPSCAISNKLSCMSCIMRIHLHIDQRFRKLTVEERELCSYIDAISMKKELQVLTNKKAQQDKIKALRQIDQNLVRQLAALQNILPETISTILEQYTLKGEQLKCDIAFDPQMHALDKIQERLDKYMKQVIDKEQEEEQEMVSEMDIENNIEKPLQVHQTENHEIEMERTEQPQLDNNPKNNPPPASSPKFIQLTTPTPIPPFQVKVESLSVNDSSKKRNLPTIKITKARESLHYDPTAPIPTRPNVIQIEQEDEINEIRQCKANAELNWSIRKSDMNASPSQQPPKTILTPVPLPRPIVHRRAIDIAQCIFNSFQNAANYVLSNTYLTLVRITINTNAFDDKFETFMTTIKKMDNLETFYLRIGSGLALDSIELRTIDTEFSQLNNLHTLGIIFHPHTEASKNYRFERLTKKLGMGLTIEYISESA